MKTSSQINFTVELDENMVPESIVWEAGNTTENGIKKCKAMMTSVWDPFENNTLRIDLWTKDMLIEEMKLFFHQSMLSMADSFARATGDEKMAEEMRGFSTHFAEKMGLIKKRANP